MVLAILTDIHGNADALEAVLDDLSRQVIDGVVLGGDLLMNGPKPGETLERLAALNFPTVRGNMDQAVIDNEDPVAAWTRDQVGPQGLAYLEVLPMSCRVTPPTGNSPQDDLLIVHSTPRGFNDLLLFKILPETTFFTATTPPEEAEAMLAGVQANLIVYGHIHFFSEGNVSGCRVQSVGSVGFPFDGDPRAAYAIVRWNGQEWALEPRRVAYDYECAAKDLEESGIPYARRYATMIRRSCWLPKNGFLSG